MGLERLKIISPYRLATLLLSTHSRYLVDNAVGMLENCAKHSSRTVTSGLQGAIIGGLITAGLFSLVLAPHYLWLTLHVLFSVFFTSCILLRLVASHFVNDPRSYEKKASALIAAPVHIPLYSVMIALYDEAEVVSQLVAAMKSLDWPCSRLEVLFLCEADDRFTLEAFEAEMLPPGFRVISVPGVGPRTKPKALNYGLQLATGDFVVVYDAEDVPHPDQLREAWQRFATGPDKLACLQAPLVIANHVDSWIARQFAFEYAAHFGGLLPWLANGRFVMPLGGSSNHFRRDCLVKVGGWDPFNVTEDAELGSRLARSGYDVDMLTLPTMEDAPVKVGIWLKQRSRWLKGWMQTWLVEMRQPVDLLKQVGIKRFLVYHILAVGLIVSALLYPFMLVFIISMAVSAIVLNNTMVVQIPILDLINFVSGFLSFHLLGRVALKQKKISGQILLGLPFYWLLISAAAWRALGQLYKEPFRWEKTPHLPTKVAAVVK